MSPLAGKRILVAEDEYLVAGFIEDVLQELGAVVVGPVDRVREGVALAREEVLDAAILDVNLNNERSDPIAEVLTARGIPFILATGYGKAEMAAGAPILEKPYTDEKLARVLGGILQPPEGG